jgi:hypothetical protein
MGSPKRQQRTVRVSPRIIASLAAQRTRAVADSAWVTTTIVFTVKFLLFSDHKRNGLITLFSGNCGGTPG